MTDLLVGYLLGALEPAEHSMVEAELARDPSLKQQLDLLARSLKPLAACNESFDPPGGLAQRTCEFVAARARTVAPLPAPLLPGRWSLVDMVVAAGIFFAATMLFFPAVNQSQFTARVLSCQNNLRQIGVGMSNYSETYDGLFPVVPFEGNHRATALSLIEHGLAADPSVLICPASPLADRAAQFRVLTRDEARRAHAGWPRRIYEQLTGSYGYTWGHFADGSYQPTRNRRRPTFALVADAPGSHAPYHSLNHGGCGQNVLFEDGHVQYMTTCRARGCSDNIFMNDDGQVAPGLHPDDAVIGPSSFKLLVPVSYELIIEVSPEP